MIYSYNPKLVINLDKISKNYQFFQGIAPNSCVAAVLKANAYGVGALQVADILYHNNNCRDFYVANIDEAIELKQKLIDVSDINIFVLSGYLKGYIDVFRENKLIPVINNIDQLQMFVEDSKHNYNDIKIAIHFDTGMNRLGFKKLEVSNILNIVHNNKLNLFAIISHLSSADDKINNINIQQLELFKEISDFFPNVVKSFSNSPGALLGKDYHFNMLRIGKGLYGPNENVGLDDNNLEMAVSLYAPIIQCETILEDGFVGYNNTYKIKKDTKIATIAIGYADGYLRSYSNRGRVFFKGYKLPVIGRVSMDYMVVDCSDVPSSLISIGDFVELFGENITYADQSVYSSTSTYEIFTRLSSRISREYLML